MRSASAVLLLLVYAPFCFADWPQWRGANGRGVSEETGIAINWSATENVAWRCPLPGQGGATPVVAGGTIFVTSADGDDLVLISIDRKTGSKNWSRVVTDQNQQARISEGNSASASPCTDGKHVWAFFSRGEEFTSAVLACYDFDGNQIWTTDLAERFGKIEIQFGMTSTPVLDGDFLYLQLIHGAMVRGDNTRTGKVIKLNKLTGETVWEIERETKAIFENKHSYASPFMYNDGKHKFLICHGADCTTGHDLSDGHEIWRFTELNGPSEISRSQFDDTFRFVASPGMADGVIIIPTCKRGPTVALKVDENLRGNLDANSKQVLWTLDVTPDVSIPLVNDGQVYLLHKDGRLQSVDLNTGNEIYFERTHNVQYRSSPVYADGHVIYCGKDGVCSVVKAGPNFRIVAENAMNGEDITASPVISNGTIYLRTYEALYAIKP